VKCFHVLISLTITSAKAVLYPAFACFSVCLSISNFTEKLMIGSSKIIPAKMRLWTRKIPLSFESHPLLDPDTGFLKDSSTRHFFPQFGLYFWGKNWLDLHENFTRDVSLDKEVHIKF